MAIASESKSSSSPPSSDSELCSLFAAFDKDADGRISAAELRFCMQADADGEVLVASVDADGTISAAECMRGQGGSAGALMASVDANGDGLLDSDELARLVDAEVEEEERHRHRGLRIAFGMYDMDGNGCNTPTTLKRMHSTLGSRAMFAGLTILLFSVSAGLNSGIDGGGGFGLFLCFAGVLAGASLVAVGVRTADDDPAVLAAARALAACFRRNIAAVGLVMSSCAVAAASGGKAGQVLCFAMYALLLLGLSLISVGILGE